jgi:LmbE family N-acetylglucosaminyl deacetylase
MKTILVIAAHPDDEALGAGGTLARHSEEGDSVHITFLADGEGARGNKDNLAQRRDAAEKAGKAMGAKAVGCYDFPDNRMDTLSLLDVTQQVEKIIADINPDIIYTHHAGDLNIDHRLTHQAVLTACRPGSGDKLEAVYAFEVLSSTEWSGPAKDAAFCPNHFVDISKTFDKKQKALSCYSEEMRKFPHPRSPEAVEALAIYRGAQSGFQKAEAFEVIRTFKR